ncbi:hypothetical protein [Kitasatospora sp. NPDC001175]|uniref:hypothetical protein n=1 Tax=Kitasatospora sp. NPDC001175 TaxID=3157103 RepID=UPI003D03A445
MTNLHPAVTLPPVANCGLCGATPAVQWRRRLTAGELAAYVAAAQAARDRQTAAADPANPPAFGPLPTSDDVVRAVYACAQHPISAASAALVHGSTCTAPAAAALPNCDCTPEPAPPPDPMPSPGLPPSWQ